MKLLISFIGGLSIIAAMLLAPTQPVIAAAPTFDPDNFHNPLQINNLYYPLEPETTYTYRGTSDGSPTRDVVVVTEQTKTIIGIQTRVVLDTAYEEGVLVEKTQDYFAQDDAGNVWYFGEKTAEYDVNGKVISTEGTWLAGVNGARPGIIMEANPQVGDSYFQEHAKGVAEDQATVIAVNKTLCVSYGCFKPVLEIKEFSALDPGVVEHKYYAPNVGDIRDITVKGGSEESHLMSISHDD